MIIAAAGFPAAAFFLSEFVQTDQVDFKTVNAACLGFEGLGLDEHGAHLLKQFLLATALEDFDYKVSVLFELFLGKPDNLLGKVLASCGVHGTVSGCHGGCVADDCIERTVRGQFAADFL